MRDWLSILSLLPHPTDKYPSPRRPYTKQTGYYKLERDVPDTVIRITEPNNCSYLVEFFECEKFLKSLLLIDETIANRILDTLWGFGSAYFHIDDPAVITVINRPSYRKINV